MTGIRIGDSGPGDVRRAHAQFWGEIFPEIVRAVEASFLEAHMQNPTRAEVKHRVEVAKKVVGECRFDLRWSRPKIVAELPRLIRAKLHGTKDPRDERSRQKTTKDGVTTEIYSVDPAAAALEKELVPSAITVSKFEKELPPTDLAGEDAGDEPVFETADPDELDPPPADAPKT